MNVTAFKELIEKELLPFISLKSENRYEPIVVKNHSTTWELIGNGNYAAVFVHPSKPQWVVKVYGKGLEGLKKEIKVYEELGEHPSFSKLFGYGENYLILKRIEGITLFNAMIKGIPIPQLIIDDVDQAVKYAKQRGLNPYDVHGKNIMMRNGKGYIVDVSDFYKAGNCPKWDDLKKAYFAIYKPFIGKYHPPIPLFIMNGIRRGYRLYKTAKMKLRR